MTNSSASAAGGGVGTATDGSEGAVADLSSQARKTKKRRGNDDEDGFKFSPLARTILQWGLIAAILVNTISQQKRQQKKAAVASGETPAKLKPGTMSNLFGKGAECELFVHYNPLGLEATLPLSDLLNEELSRQLGFELLWHASVAYQEEDPIQSVNVTVPPLPDEVLHGGTRLPKLYATFIRTDQLEDAEKNLLPADQVVTQSLPLVQMLRDLNVESGTRSLLGGDDVSGDEPRKEPTRNASKQARLPYWKTKMEIRPVVDFSVQSLAHLQYGPLRKLRAFPEQGFYQPYMYISDFWLLEKDYMELNGTVAGQPMNLSLSYSVTSVLTWSVQLQMAEQWANKQTNWDLADPQRDSFMLKRLLTDTNPYFLAFSAVFMIFRTIFSMLAFKNDIQFWRKNESMQGLSARSVCISFVCQIIQALYLLDAEKETSRLILPGIFIDLALAFWKLRKAVKIKLSPTFPFVTFDGQKGYDESDTSKFDRDAIRYASYVVMPLWVCYGIRSLFVDRYRSWYSFCIGNAAGGVYAFGFINMTPQLYINYKLQSVEHLPWRALTYKALNTFSDDIFSFLVDMPMLHRVSCFRDDIIFVVYCYQRWCYRVDKQRPTIWVNPETTDDRASVEGVAEPPRVGDADACAETPSTETNPQAEVVPESPAGGVLDGHDSGADTSAGDASLRQRR
eukprot:TRINITY_DN75116_c0_g1_i1.p1 TRINITY_DN75116_c0_g1~~TRINITY_DN75116_c0_g1_i1.p1  ORF type:complete len:733 (+),score=102.29 TRINITY_DN75116_c0_g1_i1:164-2200(+)